MFSTFNHVEAVRGFFFHALRSKSNRGLISDGARFDFDLASWKRIPGRSKAKPFTTDLLVSELSYSPS